MVAIKIPGRGAGGGNGEGRSLDLTVKLSQLGLGDNAPTPTSRSLVRLHPFRSGSVGKPLLPEGMNDGVLVKIQPPMHPANRDLHHVPCDIVLSIDVSYSMISDAPMPKVSGEEDESNEFAGFSTLDLVKHAARTIMETLDSKDRLGIVTFSTNTKVCDPYMRQFPRQAPQSDTP